MPIVNAAKLDVSASAYEEIKQRLILTGHGQRVVRVGEQEILDLGARDGSDTVLVLSRETDEKVKVFLVYNGRVLNKKEEEENGGGPRTICEPAPPENSAG